MIEPIVTIDPTTGSQIESINRFTQAEIDSRLVRAEATYRDWRTTSFTERTTLFGNLAKQLRAQSETLAAVAVREMGKPIVQARAEIEKCAWTCDYFALHGAAMFDDVPIATQAPLSYAAFRPLGIILAIMPWNFPYWQVFRAAVPAILAGNAMLLSHSNNTTRCALEIEGLFRDAGAPDDLFTTMVITHDDIARILADRRIVAATLTGSERAGVAVARTAGSQLKKTVLELGGSDAYIVLSDADIDAVARRAVTARFQNNGQSCIAAKRFIVEESVYVAFVEAFAAHTRDQRVGNPLDEKTDIGPVAREDLRTTLQAQVQSTIDAGGTRVLGGRQIDGNGFFYEPTIVSGVLPGMRMFDEETFGPAAAVISARDARHAVELANASSFGLGASIHTKDIDRAQLLARDIESGMVFVNAIVASDARLPFGGVKRSGYGRELSVFGVHEFTNIQTVSVS